MPEFGSPFSGRAFYAKGAKEVEAEIKKLK